MFKVGYDGVEEKLKKRSHFIMSCDNCKHFYQDIGDAEELCQNNEVLPFDIVVEEKRVYCHFWEG